MVWSKYDALKGKYASTTTLRSQSGCNEFLDLVKKDALTCHGQIAVTRAQIPKYQREAGQPLRCAILVYSQIVGKHQRYKPTWELSAVGHEGEWILHMQAQENDKTRLTIYVAEALKQHSSDKFAEEWATRGAKKGSSRRADGYRPQDFFQVQVEALTTTVATELNEKHNAIQEQKRQTSKSSRHTHAKS